MLLSLEKKDTAVFFPDADFSFDSSRKITSLQMSHCLTKGHCLSFQQPFNYIDLGGGDPYSLAYLAMGYPQGQFYSICMDSDRFKDAQKFKADYQLSNFHPIFIHTIKDVYTQKLKSLESKCQCVTIYDEWAFSSLPKRKEWLEALDYFLQPGGYAVVSYDAYPGWDGYKVMLDIIKEIVRGSFHELSLKDSVLKAFDYIEGLAQKKVPAFKDEEKISRLKKYMMSLSPYSLYKILFSPIFQPMYLNSVAQGFKSKNFEFLSSLPLSKNYLLLGLVPSMQPFIKESPDNLVMSQRHDLITLPFRRIDIFQKLSVNIERIKLNDFYFGVPASFKNFATKATCEYFNIEYKDVSYRYLFQIMRDRWYKIEDIQKICSSKGYKPQQILEQIQLLLLGYQIDITETPPDIYSKANKNEKGKLSWVHPCNQQTFNDLKECFKQGKTVIHPDCHFFWSFDQQTAFVLSAASKVPRDMVAQYCREEWTRFMQNGKELPEQLEKKFQYTYDVVFRYYIPIFRELGLINPI